MICEKGVCLFDCYMAHGKTAKIRIRALKLARKENITDIRPIKFEADHTAALAQIDALMERHRTASKAMNATCSSLW